MKKEMSVSNIERKMVDIYQTQCREDKVYKAAQRINDLKLQRWSMMRDVVTDGTKRYEVPEKWRPANIVR